MFDFLKRKSQVLPVTPERVEPTVVVRQKGQGAAHQAYGQRYAAAKSDRLNVRLTGGGLSVDETLRRDVERLRAASRKAGEDVGYVKRYYGMVQTHVVGDKGFRFQSQARDVASDLDKVANQAIEKSFKDWGRMGNCEISGRMGLVEAEQLIAKTVSQDGDMIIQHIDGAPNKYGYAFRLIEADLLDVQLYKDLGNGNRIKMGVELDPYGRHIAYHLLASHPGEYTWAAGGRRYTRILASEIILPFPMWRPGQTRGVPWAHAALLDMHDIAGYREATLVGARVGASNMLIYERDPDLEPPADDRDWSKTGDFIHELEPGASTIAPQGYRARESQFNMPDESVGDFQKSVLRGASSGLEANYNVLGNDYQGVSWSSLRQAILEDREHWRRLHGWFISQIMTPIHGRWLRNALLKDAIDGLRAYDLERVNHAAFRGRSWQWVDPLKDEQAVGEAMGNFTINPLDVLDDKGIDLDDMAEGWDRFLEAMGPSIEKAQAVGLVKNKLAVAKGKVSDDPEIDSDDAEK